jgi:cytochrome P450
LLQSFLSPAGSESLSNLALPLIEKTVETWPTGELLDLEETLGALVTDLGFQLVMGHDLGERRHEVYQWTHALVKDLLSSGPLWFPLPRNIAFRRKSAELQGLVDTIIQDRLREPFPPADFLLTLLASSCEKQTPAFRDARDELLSVYFGASTMKIGMVWMFYALSGSEHAQADLRREIEATLGGELPSAQRLKNLKWPLMIFNETTRLYPPVWGFPRVTPEPLEIGGCPIPARSLLLPLSYLAHRHPAHWEAPEEFRPERFDPVHKKNRHPFAHYPFGFGPRMCPGRFLAPLLFQQLLIAVWRRYRVEVVCEDGGRDCGTEFEFELTPSRRLLFKLERLRP